MLETSQGNFINQKKKKPIRILEEQSSILQMYDGGMDFGNEVQIKIVIFNEKKFDKKIV